MYEAYYGLSGKPFQLTPDPDLLFPSLAHKRAMSYLLYGLEQGEGFVVITGAVGTGKTLLIQTLAKSLGNQNRTMGTISSANLDKEDVLAAVASAFNLPFEGASREALYHELASSLRASRAAGSRALLVVDEAQMLTRDALEVLRMLSNLEVKGRALLQIFLVGQSELRNTVTKNNMEQLKQRIIASCELQSLGEKEAQAYVLHRLRLTGWQRDPELTPTIFPVIHRASQGIPRKINLIMSRLLLYGYLEELHELDCSAVATVLQEMEQELPSLGPRNTTVNGDAESAHQASKGEEDLLSLEAKLSNLLRDLRKAIGH